MLKIDNNIICVVCWHTYGWTEQCIKSLRQYCPYEPLLFIDNNPSKDDKRFRKESYNEASRQWKPACETERAFIHSVPFSTTIQTPHFMYHGEALDFALVWCKANRFQTLTLIEPDCLIRGDVWLRNLKRAIFQGGWMAGSFVMWYKAIHPCPSIWQINKLNHSFKTDFVRKKEKLNKEICLIEDGFFDTAIRAWYHLAEKKKAITIKAPDFSHVWNGSYIKRWEGERFHEF